MKTLVCVEMNFLFFLFVITLLSVCHISLSTEDLRQEGNAFCHDGDEEERILFCDVFSLQIQTSKSKIKSFILYIDDVSLKWSR
jgi:hypothetical protein